MNHQRRQVLQWGLSAVVLSQTACINLSPFPQSTPATTRSERMDYGGAFLIYYNEHGVAYLTPKLHLVFQNVRSSGFDFRKLPDSLLRKAYARIGWVNVGSQSRGSRSYGNAQSIGLTFKASDLNAQEKALLESMGVRASESGGSEYTNALIAQKIVQAKEMVYDAYIGLYSDFNNVFYQVSHPSGFFNRSIATEKMLGFNHEIPLNDAAAKRQQQTFTAVKSPVMVGADGRVTYKGKAMRRLDEQVNLVTQKKS